MHWGWRPGCRLGLASVLENSVPASGCQRSEVWGLGLTCASVGNVFFSEWVPRPSQGSVLRQALVFPPASCLYVLETNSCGYLPLQEFFSILRVVLFFHHRCSLLCKCCKCLLGPIYLFLFYLNSPDSKRWMKKELAAFCVKVCSAFFLKSFIVSVHLIRPLIFMCSLFLYVALGVL